jgi:Holliday junction resolvase
MGTGHAKERELARRLSDESWMVMRSPASGSVDRPQPDLLATHPDRKPVAIESKYNAEKRTYLSPKEGRELCSFASAFGAIALVIFRWKGDTRYWARKAVALPTTDGGSYVGDHEAAREEDWQDGNLPNSVLGIEPDAEAESMEAEP